MSRISFQDGISAVSVCHVPFNWINDQDVYMVWNRRWLRLWHESHPDKMGLLALVACTSDSESSDPRDRIYSVLGLTNDIGRDMIGRPTYQLPVEDVFVNFVRSFIETYKSLDAICFAQIYRQPTDSASGTDSNLPSWVPDWRTPVKSCPVPLMVCQSSRSHIGNFRHVKYGEIVHSRAAAYAAAGTGSPQVSFSGDFQRLTCRGLFLDFIDGLGGLRMPSKNDTINSQVSQDLPLVQSTSPSNTRKKHDIPDPPPGKGTAKRIVPSYTIDDMIRCFLLDREDTYLTYPATPEQLRPELQSLLGLNLDTSKGVLHPALHIQYQQFRDLLIGGFTLDEICRASPAAPGSSYNGQDSFAHRFLDTTASDTMACRPMTTEKGYLGMVSKQAQKGDLVCVLHGCSVPVVLRKREDRKETYTFISECYIHRFMNGEIFDHNDRQADEDFILL